MGECQQDGRVWPVPGSTEASGPVPGGDGPPSGGRLGLTHRTRDGDTAGLGPDEYRPVALARRLRIGRDTVRSWMRVGWVHVRRDDIGHRVIWADARELRRLRDLHRLPRTWANKARLAELKKPKPRPAR